MGLEKGLPAYLLNFDTGDTKANRAVERLRMVSNLHLIFLCERRPHVLILMYLRYRIYCSTGREEELRPGHTEIAGMR